MGSKVEILIAAVSSLIIVVCCAFTAKITSTHLTIGEIFILFFVCYFGTLNLFNSDKNK